MLYHWRVQQELIHILNKLSQNTQRLTSTVGSAIPCLTPFALGYWYQQNGTETDELKNMNEPLKRHLWIGVLPVSNRTETNAVRVWRPLPIYTWRGARAAYVCPVTTLFLITNELWAACARGDCVALKLDRHGHRRRRTTESLLFTSQRIHCKLSAGFN